MVIMGQLRAFGRGLSLPLMLYAPLSVISYFNETYNGCFELIVGSCPQPPSYYHLPSIAALFLTLILLMFAWGERGDHGSHERGFSKGLVLGTILGVLTFLFFWFVGFWGWEDLL